MLSDKIIIDEPFIWTSSINEENTTIELSKVTDQQHFLISKDPKVLLEYFKKINQEEVRRIDQVSRTAPFTKFGDMRLLLIYLN